MQKNDSGGLRVSILNSAAVDYGVANLTSLKNLGYNIDSLNDAEKSRLIYLAHHLGLKNADLFIQNAIEEDEARMLLIAQVGKKSAERRCQREGSYVEAHREWLTSYIDHSIKLFNHYCLELTKPPRQEDAYLKPTIAKL
ncbi:MULTISPECIES: hypothetical protein [Enterobacterales]|uniref:hypothetical protein n=1 Tax=Enterobacterales TaxID=91347 RepID=UPI002EDBB6BD